MEKNKNLQLHLCCGDVYLTGYLNVDIKGRMVGYKDIINTNETTLKKYFKYPFGTPRGEVWVDYRMNILEEWDFDDSTIKEIVMISSIEHFFEKDAKFIMSEIKRVLQPNGTLIIDFPDIKKDVELFYEKDPRFLMELIYCNQKDMYSAHRNGFTKKTFLSLLGTGWKKIEWKNVITHAYPMMGCIATKNRGVL